MPDVYVGGKRIRLDPTRSIGKGGEADVYDIGGSRAIKLFKPPDHPDYEGEPHEQKAAAARIAEHQVKLREFPRQVPAHVITPQELATNQSGNRVLGYTMHLVSGAEVLMRYGERAFREAGIPNETVVVVFRDLHATVMGLHLVKVVIGDFNDLNVLVRGNEAYLIDADSAQFGRFKCSMFMARFVDPLLCDSKATSLQLVKPHTETSDWYAFMVMLMQSFLYVDPYGGIYRPRDQKQRIPHGARPLHRITVFHPEVGYPKPAIHYKVLPDDLLELFHRTFEKDQRGEFPVAILNNMRWTTCIACATEHARAVCPSCAQAAPAAVKEVTRVRGKVTSTRIFRTDSGLILFATVQNGNPLWVYHENGEFRREDHGVVRHGPRNPQMRFRIRGNETLIGEPGTFGIFRLGASEQKQVVDNFGLLPVFDANESHRYWLYGGQLFKDGQLAPEIIGNVLQNQTLFWAGPKFGFGFYRAGTMSVAFVFDAKFRGINDQVKLPPFRGQLIDATCVFGSNRCWLFMSSRIGGKTMNQCYVIKSDGTLEATTEAEAGDGSWLSSIRGSCAAGNFLLAVTDDGLVRVEPSGSTIAVTKEFPDTEPFVDTGCTLYPGASGLYVVDRQEIRLLKIA